MLGACFSPEVLILSIRKYASMYMFDAKTGIVFSIWYCRCISQKALNIPRLKYEKDAFSLTANPTRRCD